MHYTITPSVEIRRGVADGARGSCGLQMEPEDHVVWTKRMSQVAMMD